MLAVTDRIMVLLRSWLWDVQHKRHDYLNLALGSMEMLHVMQDLILGLERKVQVRLPSGRGVAHH